MSDAKPGTTHERDRRFDQGQGIVFLDLTSLRRPARGWSRSTYNPPSAKIQRHRSMRLIPHTRAESNSRKAETALITGTSSSVGLHLSHEIGRYGHPVVLVAPVEAELRRISDEFRAQHGAGRA
jgi:hypothetical protein